MERGSKRKSGAAALAASSPSEGRAAKRQKTPEPPLTLKLSSSNNNNKAATTSTPTSNKKASNNNSAAATASTPTSNKKAAGGAAARETVESTTDSGQKFLDQLRNARDKNGRLIATSFLQLPDRKQLPEYYEHTKLPISIETMQEKLSRGEFSTLTQIESDIKRMVNNAKSFNESKSDVYLDAERIRKMTSNFMLKNNPAYKDKNYSAFPTPIPDEVDKTAPAVEEMTPVPASRSRARSKAAEEEKEKEEEEGDEERSGQAADDNAAAAEEEEEQKGDSKETEEADGAGDPNDEQPEGDGAFESKTFQEAQEQIATEMIEYQDENGLVIFTPFINLPPRSLTDYYAVIKQPTSLNGIRKKVRGVRGRGETTGVTEFKSWDAFEAEFAKIWKNAREYNQDGSEMFLLAGELEDYFRERFSQAKKAVDEPQQPTLKLNLNSKPSSAHIKLRLGPRGSGSPAPASTAPAPATATATAPAPTPTPAPAATTATQSPAPVANTSASNPASAKSTPAPNGVSIDQSALKRQQEDVKAAVNGGNSSEKSRPQSGTRVSLRSSSQSVGSPAVQANGIKAESNKEQSPASSANRPSSSASEAVNGTGLIDTRDKAPSVPPSAQSAKNTSESPAPVIVAQDPTQVWIPMHPPPTGMESRFRANGKDASDALITNVHISSHPDLPIAHPFHQDIRANATLTQQSVTLNLPATHYNLRLQPALAPSLTHDLSTNPSLANVQLSSSGNNRPYKLFVTANGQRMQPTTITATATTTSTATPVTATSATATPAPAPATNGPTTSSSTSSASPSLVATGSAYYGMNTNANANMNLGHTSPPPPPPLPPSSSTMDASHPSGGAHSSTDTSAGSKPLYDVKLLPGLNRVEVECVATSMPAAASSSSSSPAPAAATAVAATAAAAANTSSSTNPKNDLEMERVTIFVHLLRVSL